MSPLKYLPLLLAAALPVQAATITPTDVATTSTGVTTPSVGSGTAAVPEPSAAVLGTFGILCLLRRRRVSLK